MLKVIVVLASLLQISFGLFGAGSGQEKIVHLRKLGFDEDPTTMSHEVILPWLRPFKPGYCTSWEWHTDKRYRDERIALCQELSGGIASCVL